LIAIGDIGKWYVQAAEESRDEFGNRRSANDGSLATKSIELSKRIAGSSRASR